MLRYRIKQSYVIFNKVTSIILQAIISGSFKTFENVELSFWTISLKIEKE